MFPHHPAFSMSQQTSQTFKDLACPGWHAGMLVRVDTPVLPFCSRWEYIRTGQTQGNKPPPGFSIPPNTNPQEGLVQRIRMETVTWRWVLPSQLVCKYSGSNLHVYAHF